MPHAVGAKAPEGPAWTCWHVSQPCGWPGACGSPFPYAKPAGPDQDWKPPFHIHSSLHSPLANRQGPTNHSTKPARKKPSVLATETSPVHQPEPEAPALPAEHPEAVTLARPGPMGSLNFICPSGDWNKIKALTPDAVKVHLVCPNSSVWAYICMQFTRARSLVLLVTSALHVVILEAWLLPLTVHKPSLLLPAYLPSLITFRGASVWFLIH